MIATWWRRRRIRKLLDHAAVVAELRALIAEGDPLPGQPHSIAQALGEMDRYIARELTAPAVELGCLARLDRVFANVPSVYPEGPR